LFFWAASRPFIQSFASITGSYESGRDATEEAFARALAARRGVRGEGSLEGWCGVAMRVAQERHDLSPTNDADELPDAQFVEPERDPELAAALQELPPWRRLFVFLRYFADLSYAEIAAACGVTEGTVAAALAQSRAVLADRLTEGMVR
jgi:RNA polymerase sigma factor (sigma-70 family)